MANTGLIGWWRLDGRTEAGNTLATDLSGNNLHGQLGNAAGRVEFAYLDSR